MQEIIRRFNLMIFVFVCIFSHTAKSNQELSFPDFNIIIDDHTGYISNISVRDSLNTEAPKFDLLVDGNLFSLGWKVQPEFQKNEIITNKNDKKFINTYHLGNGFTVVRKISRGETPYSLLIHYEINNTSNKSLKLDSILNPYFYFAKGFNKFTDTGGGYGAWVYGYLYLFIKGKDEIHKIEKAEPNQIFEQYPTQWIGWTNRHHVTAVRINHLFSNIISINANQTFSDLGEDTSKLTPDSLPISFEKSGRALSKRLMPGESTTIAFDSITAPKQWEQLSLMTPSLDGVILINLWDWFRTICFSIWQVFLLLFNLSGSWGIAIILAALAIRIILIPITRLSLQYQNQAIQQQERIKPLLKKLKKKYNGIELSEQMVALYDKETYDHFAPFKGMLGLFVQIPILIALFNVLGEAPELKGQVFLWIDDLSLSDRLFSLGIDIPFFGSYFNLLPFILAGMTVLSTFYAVRTSDNYTPTRSLFGMAVLFFILFYSFPSALVLYWLSSIFFQLLQQIIEKK